MRAITIVAVTLLAASCAKEPRHFEPFPAPCSVEQVEGGALISCIESNDVFVPNGADGTDGRDGVDAIIEVIDPCGQDGDNFNEVLLRLHDGSLLAYFEDGGKRFLAAIEPGNYLTTDKQACPFTVHEDLSVTW